MRLKHNFSETLLSQGKRVLRRISLLPIVLGGILATAAAKDVALISNKSSALADITMAELTRICKGQTNRWPDGKPVTLVIREPGTTDLKLVEEKVYGLSPDALRELIATANHNRADHPAIILGHSDEEILRKVESVPGAVGLVDVYSITGAVKVIKIGGKLPLEAGYTLHGN